MNAIKLKKQKVTLQSLAKDVVYLKKDVAYIKRNMVFKKDLKEELQRFVTKEDAKKFATKEDLKRFATKEDLEKFATKDYLHFCLREELKNYPTKDDMLEMEHRFMVYFDGFAHHFEEIRIELASFRLMADRIDRRIEKHDNMLVNHEHRITAIENN